YVVSRGGGVAKLRDLLSGPSDDGQIQPLEIVDGALCRLFRRAGHDDEISVNSSGTSGGGNTIDDWLGEGHRMLWAPVILRILPSSCDIDDDDDKSNHDNEASETTDNAAESTITNNNDKDQTIKLYIPPCLAATIGLHCFHAHHTSTPAYLQPLPLTNVIKASHATLREIGIPPPVADLKWSLPVTTANNGEEGDGSDGSKDINTNNNNNGSNNLASDRQEGPAMECSKQEEQLRKFFLYPLFKQQQPSLNDEDNDERHIHPDFRTMKNKPEQQQSKPRQRLLTLGSIFATPSFDGNSNDHDHDSVVGDGTIENARFYQVVNVQSPPEKDGLDVNPATSTAAASTDWKESKAYIVSPLTHLVLLPPTNNESSESINIMRMMHPQLEGVPMINGHAWRMPRPSLAVSFLRSVADSFMNSESLTEMERESPIPIDSKSTMRRRSGGGGGIHHPSAKDLLDAFYLQGVIPAMNTATTECRVCHNVISRAVTSRPSTSALSSINHSGGLRIIHLIGREENHIRACVDEAADIMGMRSFHVEGLAAFWAHYHIFHAYSNGQHAVPSSNDARTPPLTGALPDKLRGLSAALEIARKSSPCVLHIAGIDHELSPTEGHAADLDTRKEEERRMLEAIRKGCSSDGLLGGQGLHHTSMMVAGNTDMDTHATSLGTDAATSGRIISQDTFLSNATTPQIIVVLSTSNPLPPGPISSSLLQSSIAISPPDINYARLLWDNNVDGTFDSLSSYLVGMPARDIRYLRGIFVPRWRIKMQHTENSMEGASKSDDSKLTNESLSPIGILQLLLPRLETARSFTQSSSRGGSSSNNNTPLPLSSSSLPNVRWRDIGGLESIRKEIMDAVELPLKYPTLFDGISRRSGILLFGPPGTGKTLVAKAVARECGLPFLSIKGPELLGSYVGESEANIRAVFDAARSAAMDPPSSSLKDGMVDGGEGEGSSVYNGASVLFFDELDSLAPRRGDTGHGDGVMDRVVATLLGELDNGGGGSIGSKQGSATSAAHVIVIGATNRPDLLDPSLLRPGRFDRLLYLGPAKTKEHCLQILLAQTRKFRFEEEEGHENDAATTATLANRMTVLERAMESFPPTLSGADLSAVASAALMSGLRRVCQRIETEVHSINTERGIVVDNDANNSNTAVDVDDVMKSWSKEKLQPTMTVEDFVEAAKEIVPSISSQDLDNFERLQRQFSSGQYS
ncbi:hypothetical protein ACHAXR_007160, partial [Thalassiosira sp. AJA248-18]